jgi:regulator of cell morphogenesis and NO signaling
MRAEHLRACDTLQRIRTLADRFVLPSWACATYAALVEELDALERDTLEHLHLENNVLAPRFDARSLAPSMQRRRSG